MGIDAVMTDVLEYDRQHHSPPLFEDRSEWRTSDAATNALTMIASVTGSVQRERMLRGLPPETLGIQPAERPTHTLEPLYSLSVSEVATDTTPRPPDIVDGYLDAGGRMVIGGPPKSMKSLLAIDLAAALASGSHWLGQDIPEPKHVLYLNLEVSYWEMRDRLQRLSLSPDAAARIRVTSEGTPGAPRHVRWGLSPLGIARAAAECERTGFAPDVVIVDPLHNAMMIEDENSSVQLKSVTTAIDDLCAKLGSVPVIVHHSRKISKQELASEPHNSLRGSGALRGWYTSSVVVESTVPGIPCRVLHHESRGRAVATTVVEYQGGDFRLRYRGWARDRVDAAIEFIADGYAERWKSS
jgi:RecA-family ATPase